MCDERRAVPRYFITRREALRVIGGTVSGLVLAACGGSPNVPAGATRQSRGASATDYSARFASFEAVPEPNGDLSKVVWPDFVTEADPEVRELYAFQVTHGELMRYMPCFCGCHLHDGHRNNRDCYVQTVNPDGSVVLDPMAPT